MKKLIVTLTIILFIFTQTIFACLCFSPPVCKAFEQADAVIVAKLINYEAIKIPRTLLSNGGTISTLFIDGQKVFLEVDKIYKGVLSKQISLEQPSTSCHWIFKANNLDKQYLFYLEFNKNSKEYEVSVCGGSGSIDNKVNDLKWLNNLPNSLNRTRISGEVTLKVETEIAPKESDIRPNIENSNSYWLENKREDSFKPLDFMTNLKSKLIFGDVELKIEKNTYQGVPNIPVHLSTNNNSFTLVTDKNGLFESWDVPVGDYSVVPKIPQNFQLGWSFQDGVIIKNDSCGEIDFRIEKEKNEK